MNDYKLLAVKYLKLNKKRSLITIAGTTFMVLILYTILNVAWGAMLAHRDEIRKNADYEVVFLTETQEQMEQLLADDRIKSAYAGTYYDKWNDIYYYNALYVNVTNPYRINSITRDLENQYDLEADIHDELAWTYIQGSDGSEIVVLIFFILLIVYIMTIFGVGIIRNSIQLSMLENIRDYGNMRCIGVSNGQLRIVIFLQGFILETIGVIGGSIIGTILSLILSGVIQAVLGITVYGGFHLLPFALVYLSYMFDLYFSMQDNAKLVTKMTPVSAIRGEYRIKKEKLRIRDKNIFKKLLGVDGDYAYKNVMRNPSRFLRTVGALAFGAAALMVAMGTESSLYKYKQEQLKDYKYYQFFFEKTLEVDYTIDYAESILPPMELLKKFSESREVSEVKQAYEIISMVVSPEILFDHYTEEYLSTTYEGRTTDNRRYSHQKLTDEEINEKSMLYTKFDYGVKCYGYAEDDLARYEKVLEAGTTNLSEHGIILINGATLLENDYSDEREIVHQVTLTDYQVGDTIELINFAELNRRMVEGIDTLKTQYSGRDDEDAIEEFELKKGQLLRSTMQEMIEEGDTITYTIEGIVSEDVNVYQSKFMSMYPIRIIMRQDSWNELSGLDESRPTGILYHFDRYPESMMFFTSVTEWINYSLNYENDWAETSEFISSYFEMQMLEKMMIFSVVIVAVILLMSILNMINTTASNLHLRRKEFAQLRVIGVSKKHLIRMVLLEGVITSIVADAIGIILGTAILLSMNPVMSYMTGISFHFPWIAMLIAIVFTMLILCGAIYIPLRSLPNDMATDLKAGGD